MQRFWIGAKRFLKGPRDREWSRAKGIWGLQWVASARLACDVMDREGLGLHALQLASQSRLSWRGTAPTLPCISVIILQCYQEIIAGMLPGWRWY
jgi:hypothetical protein